ncbi:NfeD family protein [Camelimonas sp. ID_303_24]
MDGIETSWLLMIGGVALMALEIVAPGVYLLWFGLAALLAGAVDAAFGLGWQAALAAFCLFSIATVAIGRWLTRSAFDRDDDRPVVLNRRASALIGRTAPLHDAIVDGRGTVRIDDTVWRVRGPDAPAGARVRLVAVEGVGFVVEPAE